MSEDLPQQPTTPLSLTLWAKELEDLVLCLVNPNPQWGRVSQRISRLLAPEPSHHPMAEWYTYFLGTETHPELAESLRLVLSQLGGMYGILSRERKLRDPHVDADTLRRLSQRLLGHVARAVPSGALSPPKKSALPCPVVLGKQGENPLILGKTQNILTAAQYDVVLVLVNRYPDRVPTVDLVKRSTRKSAVDILKRLAKSDAKWRSVLQMAQKKGLGYGLRTPKTPAGRASRRDLEQSVASPIASGDIA